LKVLRVEGMKGIKGIERVKGIEVRDTGIFREERIGKMKKAPLKGYLMPKVG